MTRILRLLMIATVAWPLWQSAVAQEVMQETLEGRRVAKQLTPESSMFVTVPSLDDAKPSEGQNSQIEATAKANVDNKQASSNHALSVVYPTDLKTDGKASKAPALKAAPPASVAEMAEDWNISTNFFNNADGGFINYHSTVKVAFDGNNIYVAGLCYWLPDAWVQGTIDGNTATFPTGQFYGNYANNYDMYFVGTNHQHSTICDVTFTYNPSTKTLRLTDNLLILVGADADGGYYAYHINTVIAKEYVDPPVEVGIAEGTDANQRVPIYGEGYDYSTTSQMIYPASMLSGFEDGRKIKSVTFYTNDNGIQFRGGRITATIGTTTSTYFTGNNALTISGTTATATVVPTQGSTTLKIEFDDPLVYTAGSNIIIQLVNTTTGNYSATTWWGVQYGSGNTYYSFSSKGSGNITRLGILGTYDNTSPARLRYMPKATFELISDPVVLTDELDFEVVEVGQSKTLTAYVENANSEAVSATVTTSSPFSVTSSTESTVVLQPGATGIDVTFTPTEANAFNGTLTVDVGGSIITITLKGVGNTPGVIVVPDKDFFDGITYNWNDDDGATHTSKLSDIATDPNQIIALLRTVYTNKAIPGNYKRGCDANGNFTEQFSDVSYAAIGSLDYSGSSTSAADLTSPGNYSYYDNIGWNIPNYKPVVCKTTSYNNRTTYYTTFDQTEYKPYNEGLTMLLIEIPDDYDRQTFTIDNTGIHTYGDLLKYYVSHTMKSARIVPNAKRTGQGQNAGTLFKIDCDKMNKFFLLAKGQLRLPFNSKLYQEGSSMSDYYYFENCNFSPYPMYVYADRYYGQSGLSVNNFWDYNNGAIFSHMFEQFSPVVLSTGDDATDLYQSLINMESFGVYHDCVSVPFAYSGDDTHGHGHQFMMYGQESSSDDCQDVRDLMFFVPDYRMMKDSGRDTELTDYLNYNTQHQPQMGLFVIKQYAITGNQITNEDSYRLHLTWTSNLLDFLPGEAGQYDLYRVIINADGTKTYQAVGEFNPNTFEYYDTVPMLKNGQQVTYVVRGQDVEQFLDLQMSNEESFIIPGLDREEQIRIALNSDYYFSRYDAATQTNNYSNSVIANNTVGTNVKPSYLQNAVDGSDVGKFKFWRATLKTVDGEQVVDTENAVNFVTAWVSNLSATGGTLTYRDWTDQTNFSAEAYGHGYHQNPASSTFSIANGEVVFNGLKLYDNFRVSVEENAHPSLYVYYVTLETAVPFDLNAQGTETSTHARSNTVNVPVYKTAMTMNAITAQDVENDLTHAAPVATKFQLDARYSSRSEILGYYIYRWADSDPEQPRTIYDDEGADESPQGQAGNQGEYYTVAMNTDFTGRTSNFTTDGSGNHPDVTATFEDNFMTNNADDADTYTYAPVVELFAPVQAVNLNDGSDRTDYNTYGGPQQMTAGGIITIIPGTPVATADEFTPQTTTGTTDKCKYYYIPMTANVDLPDGYEIYKVRAWRQVDTQWLGEEDANHFDRVSNDYLFETMGAEANEANDVVVGLASEDGNVHHHTGLFGAKSLSPGESFDANFIVRVYFTKPSTSKDGEARYYIAEKQQSVTITDAIITGIANVKGDKKVASVKYYNLAGIESDQPFDGVNMVVTRYTDGSTSTTKVMK